MMWGTRPALAHLVDRWALITGASSGLGAEFARQLAARGMHLILTARRRELMEQLAEELHTRHGTRCEIIPADLTHAAERDQLWETIASRNLDVELLLNNAGFGVIGPVEQTNPAEIQEMLQLNILAVTDLTYRVLPKMLARQSGSIINLGSLSAFAPVAYMGAYAAAKAYVLHLSEALAVEVENRGVHVLAVCPGITRTEFFERAGAAGWLKKHAVMTPESVVSASLEALARRKHCVVPGWRNRLVTFLIRLASRKRVALESKRYFRPRHKPKSDPAASELKEKT